MGTGQDRKLSASLEDYLEAIFNLADESGCARSKDIAKTLGVARSSVTGALQLLREKGLAHHEPYGGVTLTRQGRAAAREVARKHEILKSFFMNVLGVEKEAAQRAACQAEHALESEIIGKLVSFTDHVTARNAGGRDEVGESRPCSRKRPAKGKE
jgi:DtxR family transcriptional regulator, Mn-dependent transcriptional regulator